MPKTAVRIRKTTGEIYVLARGTSGEYEFGDPKFGDEKHHTKHLVTRNNLEDALRAIREGYHPRMKGQDTGQFNMISPENTVIIEVET